MEGKPLNIEMFAKTEVKKVKDKEKSENPKAKKGFPEPQSS